MRQLLFRTVRATTLVLGAVVVTAVGAAADPITYGVRTDTSYLTGDGASSSLNPHDDKRLVGGVASSSSSSFSGADNRVFSMTSSASLGSGALRVTNVGSGGASHPVSASVTSSIAELLDTITIMGNFTTPVLVPFTATFEGNWTHSDLSFAGLFGQVWFGTSATVEDWSNPTDNPGMDLWNQPALFKDFGSDGDNGPVSITIAGNLELSGLNPSFVAWLRMEAAVFSENPNATWNGAFDNTGTLEFDFTGLDATSASGAFPGTRAVTPVPEPGTLLMVGAGLACVGLRLRRQTPFSRR